jgi:CRISPR/Cas system-associated exonuclease Cas4 (RecB family)
MPVDFNKLIEQHLHRDAYQKTIGRYYPSEAGNCMRKAWYSYRYPQPADPKKSKYFHLGNILHDFMAEVLESPKNKEVRLLEKEVALKIIQPDFVVSGRLDDIFMLTADNRKFILEVKSTNSKLEWMDRPQDSHIMQIQLYMHAHEIKEGIILYLEKSSLEGKWFTVKYDPSEAESVIARFGRLDSHLKSETLPEPEAKRRPEWNWMCKTCEYYDRCNADSQKAA